MRQNLEKSRHKLRARTYHDFNFIFGLLSAGIFPSSTCEEKKAIERQVEIKDDLRGHAGDTRWESPPFAFCSSFSSSSDLSSSSSSYSFYYLYRSLSWHSHGFSGRHLHQFDHQKNPAKSHISHPIIHRKRLGKKKTDQVFKLSIIIIDKLMKSNMRTGNLKAKDCRTWGSSKESTCLTVLAELEASPEHQQYTGQIIYRLLPFAFEIS